MSRLLALDIGTKRTGVAYGETESGIVMALETMKHTSKEDLARQVQILAKRMCVTECIVGLPKLLDGSEGKQSELVRIAMRCIQNAIHLPVKFVDERLTSGTKGDRGMDRDAHAACAILTVVMDQRRNQY